MSVVVAVGFGFPCGGEDRRADERHAHQRIERDAPVGVLHQHTHPPARDDRTAVAEQAAETACRGGGALGGDVRRGDADAKII